MWMTYKGVEYAVDLYDGECLDSFCEMTGLRYFRESLGEKHVVFYNPEQYRVKKISQIPVLVFKGHTETPEQPLNASNYTMMFAFNRTLEQLDLSAWDFTGIVGIYRMFYGCLKLKHCKTNFAGIPAMQSVFEGCAALVSVDTQNWDLCNTVDISACFKGCTSLKMLDVLNWKVSNLQSISEMCCDCENLESFEAARWDTSSLIRAKAVFMRCTRLKFVNINSWDFHKVQDVSRLFAGCESMFYLACDGLNKYNLLEKCNTTKVFDGCRAQVIRELQRPLSTLGTVNLNAF